MPDRSFLHAHVKADNFVHHFVPTSGTRVWLMCEQTNMTRCFRRLHALRSVADVTSADRHLFEVTKEVTVTATGTSNPKIKRRQRLARFVPSDQLPLLSSLETLTNLGSTNNLDAKKADLTCIYLTSGRRS